MLFYGLLIIIDAYDPWPNLYEKPLQVRLNDNKLKDLGQLFNLLSRLLHLQLHFLELLRLLALYPHLVVL
ncbi:Uncharacterised protein [Legionella steigerwaltii]|uniref:Uncharacterized protein n=1 Tax=Legionella steigerwaltii TaxID=460 RepID=A0A378L8A5_9GAMM|nr:hypothetical protein Lstg_2383 [Legionella steigerwaltii]STY22088.1 Uncharacterised protein [Legionella steigerwaltii]